jgi:hypothetical protein
MMDIYAGAGYSNFQYYAEAWVLSKKMHKAYMKFLKDYDKKQQRAAEKSL